MLLFCCCYAGGGFLPHGRLEMPRGWSVICIVTLYFNQGTVNQAQVYPREIARAALQVDATGIIIFHNHPAGQCQPSIDDLAVTKSLTEGLKLLERAVKNGFRDRRRLMEPAFKSLEGVPAFQNLLKVFGTAKIVPK